MKRKHNSETSFGSKQSNKGGQLPASNMGSSLTIQKSRSDSPSRVISFTSGKGGVGKSSLVVNSAVALAQIGRSVLLIDADLGLANVNVLLGLRPSHTLNDVFEGRKSLTEIMLEGPEGIAIIPAASGVESICNLSAERRLMLLDAVEKVAKSFDYILIDTQAGIGPDVMYFNSAAGEIICVITSEPTSLTDAYALIKVLSQNYGEREFKVIANNVSSEKAGFQAFSRLQRAVERFLHVSLDYLGYVPSDRYLCEAVRAQEPFLKLFPSSAAGVAISSLVRKLDASFHELRVKGSMQFLFQQLVEATRAQV